MNIRRNKRKGAVLDFAVLMMMVIFSLGLVITTSSMIQIKHKQREDESLQKQLALNAKGEEFCAAVANGDLSGISGVTGTLETDEITFNYETLTVVLQKQENESYKIIEWTIK